MSGVNKLGLGDFAKSAQISSLTRTLEVAVHVDTSPVKVRKRRRGARVLAGALATSLFALPVVGAANAAPTDNSEALGQILDANLLNIDLADAASSTAGNPSATGPVRNPLNLSLLDSSVSLDLGGGLNLPLISDAGNGGLLELGELGVAHSFASTPSATNAIGSAGAVAEDGAISVSPDSGNGPARVDLTQLFDQLNVSGLTDQILSEANLELGALASRAEKNGTTVTRDYTIADAKLNLTSPAVGELTTELGNVVDVAGTTLNAAVGDGGVLSSLIGSLENISLLGLGVDTAQIHIDGLNDALNVVKTEVLQGVITSDTGLVSVDLGTGEVTVDLAKLVGGDLNGQAPNTQLLSQPMIEAITTELTTVLSNVATDLNDKLVAAINEVQLVIDLDVSLLVGNVGVQVVGSLGDFAGTSGNSPQVIGSGLGSLVAPLLSAVVDIVRPVVGTLLTDAVGAVKPAVDGIVTSVVTPLAPVLDDVIAQLLSITLNEQGAKDLSGTEGVYVSALTLTLLPSAQAAKISLATSAVRALDEDPVIAPVDILTPGEGEEVIGSTVPVTGTAEPNTEIEVSIDGGTPQTVQVDGEGKWSTEFVDVAPGPHTVTATDGNTSDEVNFTVADESTADNTADNTDVNTADNTGDNTDVNTADNTGDNTEVNTDVNTADNTAENTGDNTEVNTDVNTADNSAENTDVNTADNSAENTDVNTADNTDVNTDVNTAENTGDNTEVNTADNSAENTDVNTADNTDVNTGDNTDVNTGDNTDVNTGDNTDVNTGDNTDVNTDVNTADNTGDNTEVNTADNSAENTDVNTADNTDVNTADNTDVNTGDNTDVNTDVNTADNTGDNTEVNTADNSAENTDVNTADNTDVNTADNTDVNTGDNTDVNTGDNTDVNTDVNTGDNTDVNTDVNTADNTGDNTEVNTADNSAENTDVNTADNTDVNTADNSAENTAENSAENTEANTADNTDVNTGDNTEVNTADNSADNTADNSAHPQVTVVPGSVEPGEDVNVIGDKFTPNGTVEVVVKNSDGEEKVPSFEVVVDENGHFKEVIKTDGLDEGIYVVEVTDNETGKTFTEYFEVKKEATKRHVAIDITPNRLVKGEVGVVTGKKFTADSEVQISMTYLGAQPSNDAQVAAQGIPASVSANGDGEISFEVDSTDLELGNYIVVATDQSGDYDFTTFTVVAKEDSTADNTAENTADNSAENTGDNTDVNTADNSAENTGDNTDVNTADNSAENTGDNTDVNTGDNTDVNTAENTDVNTAENTDVNTAENTDENTADNSAENTDVNTAENTDENTADNSAENTDVNTADNSAENTDVNTAENTDANTADNSGDNTDANTGDNTNSNNGANGSDGSANNGANGSKKPNSLAETGSNGAMVIGIGAILLIAAGIASALVARKRRVS
ncbi:choice-of-anchor G family protein [Glutamicibacter sp. X7]